METKAPQGYILNTKAVEFTIVDNYQGKPEVLILEDVINYQGRFTLNKHDEASNPLENVKFELTKPDQTTTIHLTDENGVIELDGLAPGNYTLKEVETVKGHILNTEIIEFTIASTSYNQEDVHTKTFINYYGRVELLKVNHHNRPLSNVVFDLFNELGEKVYSNLTSNQDGKIVVEHLEVGKYFFKEVESVEGHIINTQPIEFEIAAESSGKPAQVVTDKAVNYMGSVLLLKVDSVTKKPLASAEFDLVFALNGQVIAHVVTNEQGIVLIEDLPVGDYYFIETKAPKGYVLDENSVNFMIHSESLGQPDTIELTVSNSIEQVSNLPDTGSSMYPFDTLSFLFIVSGLLLIVFSKKRKEEIK